MRSEPGSPSDDTAPHEREAPGSESYQHLGDRVAAILTAAQEAAEDIRRSATEDAERTRRDAQQDADAYTEEAKRQFETDRRALEELREELDRRSKELNEEAETYRQQKRREAEAEAVEIRIAAEHSARKAQGDALLLQRWLEGTIPRFHEVTDWMERVLADGPKSAEKEDQPLDEAAEGEDFAKSG